MSRSRSLAALLLSLPLVSCALDDAPPSTDGAPPAEERPTTAPAEQPAATPVCPAGTTFDGLGCGRWSPVATSCEADEEAMPDGAFSSSSCAFPPLVARHVASTEVLPRGAVLELPSGTTVVVRPPSEDDWAGTSKAELWTRGPRGEWTRGADASVVGLPTDAAVLEDGRVIVLGCAAVYPCEEAFAEVLDAASGSWLGAVAVPDPMWGSVTLLPLEDGVLVVGSGRAARLTIDPEIFAASTWAVGPAIDAALDDPAVAVLPDGRVLTVGGSFYAWERRAYVLDLETLVMRRTADPTLYTLRTSATPALGGVVVFGAHGESFGAEVYTSTPLLQATVRSSP